MRRRPLLAPALSALAFSLTLGSTTAGAQTDTSHVPLVARREARWPRLVRPV
jgi:hypothetical protein